MRHFGVDVHLKSTEICEVSEEGEVLDRVCQLGATNTETESSTCTDRKNDHSECG